MLDIITNDGAIPGCIKAVGYGAATIEPRVTDVNYGIRAIGVDIRCSIVNCNIDIF